MPLLKTKIETIDNWFANWFDSDHYHLLYQHRNHAEAEAFISRLFQHLKLEKHSKVLDLACGKGRHALQVHQLGYNVVGVDLSEESINYASQFEEKGLKFLIGDMRYLDLDEKFDLTLNLFTSFGYFRKEGDNRAVLKGLSQHLKKDGVILIDFLNVVKAAKNLPSAETIERGEIQFHTEKQLINDFIVKDIHFQIDGKKKHFQEFVKYLEKSDFETYFEKLGMEITELFGSYLLEPFEKDKSDRLIMLAKFK